MSTHFKKCILNTIDRAKSVKDLLQLVTLLPFDALKLTLENHVKYNMNNNEIVRKEYYKRVNIENIIPLDVLAHILSFQSFQYLCCGDISTISKTMKKASNMTLRHNRNITLIISDFINHPMFTTDNSFNERLEISPNHLMTNERNQKFVIEHWNKFKNIMIPNGDLCDIMSSLNVSLQNVQNLLYPQKFNIFDFIDTAQNLEFICMQFDDINIWNILVKNCPNLHGIIIKTSPGLKTFVFENENENDLLIANNLWILKTTPDAHYKYVELMVKASPNLYYLSIDGDDADLDLDDMNEEIIHLPQNLLCLTIGSNILMRGQIIFDFDACSNLIYLAPMSIDNTVQIRNMLKSYIEQTKSKISYLALCEDVLEIDDDEETLQEFRNEMFNDENFNVNDLQTLRILTDETGLDRYGIDDDYESIKQFVMIALNLSENEMEGADVDERFLFIAELTLSNNHKFTNFMRMLLNKGIIHGMIDHCDDTIC